ETLAAGADLVTFSADKLLGGPQAGIIVGRKDLINRLRSNPIKRALRCDKTTIAALAAVLSLYSTPEKLCERLPTLRALTRSLEEIENRAQLLYERLSQKLSGIATVSVVNCDSVVGSGALPSRKIPSRGISIVPIDGSRSQNSALVQISSAFLALPTPVIGRIHAGAFVLDLRCLEDCRELIVLIETLNVQK
ncbi:MAG: aminotransferase class V-fold PLP-dependent enzyme, partial [Rhizobiaceae bacterium]